MAEGGGTRKPILTMEKLKEHDEATEERERRYFTCVQCKRQWWEEVPMYKPVSQCRKCKTDYDAIPCELEPKIGKHTCPCGNEFTGWTSEGVRSPCYECGSNILPEELLKPRPIKRKTDHTHNCNMCHGKGNCPNKQPVVASREHERTESTVSMANTVDDKGLKSRVHTTKWHSGNN